MRYTIERLISGGGEIREYWSAAVRLWGELFAANASTSLSEFSSQIGAYQSRFQESCGGRYLGQEIMAWVAVAQFYRTSVGFGEHEADVAQVIEAFRGSSCSTEAKAFLDQAIASYGLSASS